jgi:hypothetical protein
MILQYGLGCLDHYFASGDEANRTRAGSALSWLERSVRKDGSLDNHCRELHGQPGVAFYSNNSAMTLGQGISLLIRAAEANVPGAPPAARLTLAGRMCESMLQPIAEGGGALYVDGDLVLCEYCRTDGYVVLNGWVFAILGLYDYCRVIGDKGSAHRLQTTLNTLQRRIDEFLVPRKRDWSYYDNRGRIASPIYQVTHITQMDVLFRLTGIERFRDVRDGLSAGYRLLNRLRYTSRKIYEKIVDSSRYSTQR